jgi:hypothetical protein
MQCAMSLSRRAPPKLARTSVANPPKAAKVAICRLPITLSVIANRPGITIVARTARIAAAVDQIGSHGVESGPALQGGLRREAKSALAPLATNAESKSWPIADRVQPRWQGR